MAQALPRTVLRTMTGGIVVRAALTSRPRIIEQMADDCRVLAANAGAATTDGLELMGWTRTQIELHGRDAAREALKLALHASCEA